jgi:hypothetical protein
MAAVSGIYIWGKYIFAPFGKFGNNGYWQSWSKSV